jgi:uncharacterized NAD(P)/FAD-binding protein YdhS
METHSSGDRPTVAIIGGGFCGTVTAINLVRFADRPLDISIVNHRRPSPVGIAYSTTRPEHLLNVAVSKMSAIADDPRHFLDWLRKQPEFAGASDSLGDEYVSRLFFGRYIRELFDHWCKHEAESKDIRVHSVQGEAVDVADCSGQLQVQLATGKSINCDRIVLATGNLPPASLPGDDSLNDHPHYFGDPWEGWEQRLPKKPIEIVLIGASLTAIDIFLTLEQIGWPGKVIAVSRHGVWPLTYFSKVDYSVFDDDPSRLGLQELLRQFRHHRRIMRDKGIPLAHFVDCCRPFTQRIWRNLPLSDKQRFLRLIQAAWKVARHRIPPSVSDRLAKAQADGRLELVRGRVRNLEANGEKIRVRLANGRALDAGAVFNCTGPQQSYIEAGGKLFRNLAEHGTIAPDDVNLGIRVADDFSALDRAGQYSGRVFALGNLLKGTLWETTGVPEMAGQGQSIAKMILANLRRQP